VISDPLTDASLSTEDIPLVELPPESSDPEDDPAYRVFIDSLSLPAAGGNCDLVREAYLFGERAHRGQKRLSGEPYITHPLAVAGAIAEWQMDVEGVVAALLHDVMEDTAVSKTEIAERFGKPVADLVDGLSKLDKIEFQSHEEAQAENFRKMLMAMARDLRVVLIKLADRHHNLQTMAAVRADKRRRIARETLEIYAPIANRLGLNKLFRELAGSLVPADPSASRRVLGGAERRRAATGANCCRGFSRASPASCAKPGSRRRFSAARRACIRSIARCSTSGCRFRRCSISTVFASSSTTCRPAISPSGRCTPVQAGAGQVQGLHRDSQAERLSVAAHDADRSARHAGRGADPYRGDGQRGAGRHRLALAVQGQRDFGADLQQKTTKWFQSLLELQSATNSAEFFEHVKVDLFPHEIYVFTPKGKIIALPRGATAVDLAYAVHTDIGNHCVAAHQLQAGAAGTELTNGDRVEIITAADRIRAGLADARQDRSGAQQDPPFPEDRAERRVDALGEKMLARSCGRSAWRLPNCRCRAGRMSCAIRGNKLIKEVYTDIGLGFRLAGSRRSPPAGARGRAAVTDRQAGARWSSAAPKAWPSSSRRAASRFRVIRSSARSGRARVWSSIPMTVPPFRKARRAKPTKWIDVEWEPEPGKLFNVRLQVDGAEHGRCAGANCHRDLEFGNQHRACEHGREAPGACTRRCISRSRWPAAPRWRA
jgi:guanosine-3',5'-bis(diphosphate) 3'-pyrophosphohydrolase